CAVSTLQGWRKKGCVLLGGQVLLTRTFDTGFGRTAEFYSEKQIHELKAKRAAVGSSPTNGIGLLGASKALGVPITTLRQASRRKLMGLSVSKKVLGRAKDGGLCRIIELSRDEVEQLKASRQGLVPADRMTPTEAMNRLKIDRATIHRWRQFCPQLGR